MNYLGHAYLSPADEPALLVGNLAGDSIRRIETDDLSADIRRGIKLHLRIDGATDASPAFKELRTLLSRAQFPYAGVVADLMVDYALGSCWKEFSSEEFALFKGRVYACLNRSAASISRRFSFTAMVLTTEDWFESYLTLDGMETAFYRLNRKTSRDLPLSRIMTFLVREDPTIQALGRQVVRDVAALISLPEHTV